MRRKNTTSDMMKQYIIESFLLLLKKQDYAQITIGEITKKAGVNRSTYYRHFSSKEDIITEYYKNLLFTYMQNASFSDACGMQSYLRELFSAMTKHKDELLLIHASGHSYLLLKVFNEYFTKTDSDSMQTMKSYYHAGGIFNCNLYWFDNEMNISPEEMARLAILSFPKDYFTVRHEIEVNR